MKARLLNHIHQTNPRKPPLLTRACVLLSLLLLNGGCALTPLQPAPAGAAAAATEGAVKARNDDLIGVVSRMQAGETTTWRDMLVESGPAYSAASGNECRPVTMRELAGSGTPRSRLACQGNSGWFFAADVFASGGRGD